jgi:GMP synthase (glutamine-hydrolysing)
VSLPPEFNGYEAIHFPIKSVGVQGDGRTYREVIALKGPLDYERLNRLSTLLCNTNRIYNRAIVQVAGAHVFTNAHVRQKALTPERIALLRACDAVVRKIMESKGVADIVWQFPVVLIPVSFAGGETIVFRPVNSEDGMTANFARLPLDLLNLIGESVMRVAGVDGVFLDITDKPPATIEWE